MKMRASWFAILSVMDRRVESTDPPAVMDQPTESKTFDGARSLVFGSLKARNNAAAELDKATKAAWATATLFKKSVADLVDSYGDRPETVHFRLRGLRRGRPSGAFHTGTDCLEYPDFDGICRSRFWRIRALSRLPQRTTSCSWHAIQQKALTPRQDTSAMATRAMKAVRGADKAVRNQVAFALADAGKRRNIAEWTGFDLRELMDFAVSDPVDFQAETPDYWVLREVVAEIAGHEVADLAREFEATYAALGWPSNGEVEQVDMELIRDGRVDRLQGYVFRSLNRQSRLDFVEALLTTNDMTSERADNENEILPAEPIQDFCAECLADLLEESIRGEYEGWSSADVGSVESLIGRLDRAHRLKVLGFFLDSEGVSVRASHRVWNEVVRDRPATPDVESAFFRDVSAFGENLPFRQREIFFGRFGHQLSLSTES